MKRFLTSAALAAALALGIGHFAYGADLDLTGDPTFNNPVSTATIQTGDFNSDGSVVSDIYMRDGNRKITFDFVAEVTGNADNIHLQESAGDPTARNLELANDGENVTLNGVIYGSGDLTINSANVNVYDTSEGLITLKGGIDHSGFTGGVTMLAGTLALDNSNALGLGYKDLTFTGTAAKALVMRDDILLGETTTIVLSDDSANNYFSVEDNDEATFSGAFKGSWNTEIVKIGTGTLILDGSSDSTGTDAFVGTFGIESGTVKVENDEAFGGGTIEFLRGGRNTAKTLDLDYGTIIENDIIVNRSYRPGSNNNFINVDDFAVITGDLSTEGGYDGRSTLTKTGNGTLAFAGNGKDFSGVFTVSAGTLDLIANDPLLNNPTILGSNVVVNGGATLRGYNPLGAAEIWGDITLYAGSRLALIGEDGKNPFVGTGIDNISVQGNGDINVAEGAFITFVLTPGSYKDGDFIVVSDHGTWNSYNSDTIQWEANTESANNAMLFANDPFYKRTAENNIEGEDFVDNAIIRLNRNSTLDMSNIYSMSAAFHNHRTIADATSNRMTWNMYRASSLPVGKCAVEELSCKPKCGGFFGGDVKNSVWGNYIYRNNDKMFTSLGENMEFTTHGVQAGLDLYSTKKTQFGIMFGYENQKLDGSIMGDKLEADDYYVGLYGAHAFGNGWDVRGTLGYNRQEFDMVRHLNNGPFLGLPRSTEFDGEGFEATVELGKRFNLSRCLTLRPSVGFDVYHTDIDAVNETSLIPNNRFIAKYNGIDMTRVYARVGADFMLTKNRYDINVGAYYSYQMNNSASGAKTTVTSDFYQNDEWTMNYQLGRSILSLNAGASYYLNQARTLSFYAGYNGNIYFDRAGNDPWSHTVTAGFQWKF